MRISQWSASNGLTTRAPLARRFGDSGSRLLPQFARRCHGSNGGRPVARMYPIRLGYLQERAYNPLPPCRWRAAIVGVPLKPQTAPIVVAIRA